MRSHFPALGLMSGTSVDGIDAALIMTDGQAVERLGATHYQPFTPETKEAILTAMDMDGGGASGGASEADMAGIDAATLADLTAMIADEHTEAALALIEKAPYPPRIIGFHGQTIRHDPERGVSLQIGDAERLARRTRLPVAYDFRSADMAAGGQGAPLAPIYHQAVVESLRLPLPAAIANIGGISNISIWDGAVLHGHDTGPGNALMDQCARDVLGQTCDLGGRMAASGTADMAWVESILTLPYFSTPAPKSLDRRDLFRFCEAVPPPVHPAHRMASFLMLTAMSLVRACKGLAHLVVAGGGARNPVLLEAIRTRAPCPVTTLDDHGWDGDFLEAELMAYLAVRCKHGLPLTFPHTTGAHEPTPGGRIITP